MPKKANPTVDWTELTKALSEPFEEHEIKYRAGAVSRDKKRAQALPYADPRVYEDRLNALVPGAWEVEFEPWGDTRIICRLSIHGVTRSSTGESGDGPDAVAGTAAEAQSFKRACAKFGLGRYLYAMDAQWVDYDADKRQLLDVRPHKPQKPSPQASQFVGPERAAAMHRALRETGLPLKRHEAFASEVLKRHVTALQELSEAEARKVWAAARSRSRERAA